MSSSASLAKRYVKALFELADSMGKIDIIARDLSELDAMIGASDDLRDVIKASAMSRDDQAKIMKSILAKAGADDLMVKFVGTICMNGRLFALPQMIKVSWPIWPNAGVRFLLKLSRLFHLMRRIRLTSWKQLQA